MTCRVTK